MNLVTIFKGYTEEDMEAWYEKHFYRNEKHHVGLSDDAARWLDEQKTFQSKHNYPIHLEWYNWYYLMKLANGSTYKRSMTLKDYSVPLKTTMPVSSKVHWRCFLVKSLERLISNNLAWSRQVKNWFGDYHKKDQFTIDVHQMYDKEGEVIWVALIKQCRQLKKQLPGGVVETDETIRYTLLKVPNEDVLNG